MPDDTIHEGNWVKVKCPVCEGRGYYEKKTGTTLVRGMCRNCEARKFVIVCVGLKPAPAPVKEGAD